MLGISIFKIRYMISYRLGGHFTFRVLISNFGIGLGAPWASQMHCLVVRTMVWGQATTVTWFYFAQSCSLFMPWRASPWWGKNEGLFTKSGRHLAKRWLRMRWLWQ